MARSPVSPPMVRLGICEIRKISAQIRDFSSPSPPSARRPRMSSSISLSSTPLCSMPGDCCVVDEVAADDVADRVARRPRAAASWTILQLRPQHAGLAGAVDRPQRELPEAPAGRQQRVVGDEVVLVGRLGRELRAAEVPVDLTADRVERRLERRDVLGLLAKHDLAHDGLDVLVGERDLDGEAVGQLLQRRRRRQRALPGRDEEHLALEARRAALDDVLHGERLLVVVADVLLHLVEHDERERQLARRSSTGGGARRP